MFVRLLSIETRKLLKHPLLWLEFTALLGIFCLYFAVRYAMMADSVRNGLVNTRGLELDLQVGIGLFVFLSILFYAATAALAGAYDFPDRGVQMWLVRGVPRSTLVVARLVLVLFFGFALVTVSFLVTLSVAALMRTVFLGSYSTQNLDWVQVVPAVLRIFWGAVPYLALTVLFAIVSRSPLFAAGGVLIFRTVIENLLQHLADRFPGLVRLLPAWLMFVLEFNTQHIDRTATPIALGEQFLTEPQATLAVAGLLLFFGSLAVIVFTRQDWGG